MKKLLMLLLVLSCFTFISFAEEEAAAMMPTAEEVATAMADLAALKAGPAVTLTGSANTTFGIDLNNTATGFETSASATAAFTLIGSQSATKAGEDGLYGEITVSGFGVTGSNSGMAVSAASAAAKIVAGSLYVTIGADPSYASNKAVELDADNSADVAVDADKQHGITIGMTGDVAFAVKVSSHDSWVMEGSADASANTYYVKADGTLQVIDDDNPLPAGATLLTAATTDAAVDSNNADNNYSIGADVSIKLADMGSLALAVAYDLPAKKFGLSVGAPLTLGPLGLTIGADVVKEDAADMVWDLAAGVKMAAGPASVTVDAYIGTASTDDDVDLKVGVDLSSLADPLTLKIAADLFNVFDVINLSVNGAYDLNGLKPYASFGIDGLTADTPTMKFGIGADLSADFTGIENTKINIDYSNSNLDSDKGIFKVGATISL
jgi:hypothetical protein